MTAQLDTDIEYVTVEEILEKVTSSIDLGRKWNFEFRDNPVRWWFNWFAWKSEDSSFWELTDFLVDGGELTVPIELHEMASGEWEMGNGHHRVAAAVLAGYSKRIPVLFERKGNRVRNSWDRTSTETPAVTGEVMSDDEAYRLSHQLLAEVHEWDSIA